MVERAAIDMDWPPNDLYRCKSFEIVSRRPVPHPDSLVSGFLVPGYLA